MRKRVTILGGFTGLILVAVTAFAVEPAGNVGVVSIESVAEPILTPRVRVLNHGSDSIVVWIGSNARVRTVLLGVVPPTSTATFELPKVDERVKLVATDVTGQSVLMDKWLRVERHTDIPVVIGSS